MFSGPDTSHLIRLGSALAECGLSGHKSLSAISNKVAGGGTFFRRISRPGVGCSVKTYNRVLQWFSDNWPVDLPWPADIPRPPKSQPIKEAS